MLTHYLQNTMENFYLCSHLPIRAFNKKGEELLSTGFFPHMSHLTLNISDWLTEAQHILKKQPHITFTQNEFIHFTLCPITPNDIESGIYLIGPYTSCRHSMDHFIFKPSHCMPHLITLLYTLSEAQKDRLSNETTLPDDYSYHIIKAEEYIHTHFKEPITLEALAKHLNLNKSYLCTIFKKATKDSFCNYTNKIRIEESKKLLLDTNESMTDIALAVGFSSASYFNTIFKKLEGKTPLEYRRSI